jgi:hypothetical protein
MVDMVLKLLGLAPKIEFGASQNHFGIASYLILSVQAHISSTSSRPVYHETIMFYKLQFWLLVEYAVPGTQGTLG